MIKLYSDVTREDLEGVTNPCKLQDLAIDAAQYLYSGDFEKFRRERPDIHQMFLDHTVNGHQQFTPEQRKVIIDMIMDACNLSKQIDAMNAAVMARATTIVPQHLN